MVPEFREAHAFSIKKLALLPQVSHHAHVQTGPSMSELDVPIRAEDNYALPDEFHVHGI